MKSLLAIFTVAFAIALLCPPRAAEARVLMVSNRAPTKVSPIIPPVYPPAPREEIDIRPAPKYVVPVSELPAAMICENGQCRPATNTANAPRQAASCQSCAVRPTSQSVSNYRSGPVRRVATWRPFQRFGRANTNRPRLFGRRSTNGSSGGCSSCG